MSSSILSRYKASAKRQSPSASAASTGPSSPTAPSTPSGKAKDAAVWSATAEELAQLRAAAGPMQRHVIAFLGRWAAKLPAIKVDPMIQKGIAQLVALKNAEAARAIRSFPASREGARAYAEWRILQLGESKVRALCEQTADMLDEWLSDDGDDSKGDDKEDDDDGSPTTE